MGPHVLNQHVILRIHKRLHRLESKQLDTLSMWEQALCKALLKVLSGRPEPKM
jgi:hypothetical protein